MPPTVKNNFRIESIERSDLIESSFMEPFIPPSDIPPLEYEQNNDAGDVHEGIFLLEKLFEFWMTKIHKNSSIFRFIRGNQVK